MTIDIRAYVYCSLGPIISGEISDSSFVDNGLVTTTGSVVLNGLFKPAIGTSVSFSYAKNGYIAKIPRSLVVLSSFADPFRNQTTVQLGCRLTYRSNAGPADQEGPDTQPTFSLAESYLVPPRISASSIFVNCAQKVGLGAIAPLTNEFVTDEFDYSGGYVNTMADLLKSECYFGYVNSSGNLTIRTLNVSRGGGPLLDETKIIDIGPTGSTDIPGDAVSVNYDSKTFVPPNNEAKNGPSVSDLRDYGNGGGIGGGGEGGGITVPTGNGVEASKDGTGDANGCSDDDVAIQKRNWEFEANNPDSVTVYDKWTDEDGTERTDEYEFIPWSWTRTTYDVWDRAVYRFEVQNGLVQQNWKSTWWTYEIEAPTSVRKKNKCEEWWENRTEENKDKYTFVVWYGPAEKEKPDNYADVLMEETVEETPEADIIQACGFAENFYPNIASLPKTRRVTLIQFTHYEKDDESGISKTRTEKYIPYVQTPEGALSIGKRAEKVAIKNLTAGNSPFVETAENIINDAAQLVKYGGEARIRTEREYGLQKRPGSAERLTKEYARQAPIEQKAEIEYVQESDSPTNPIQFDMPYAPDDIMTSTVSGNKVTYTVEPSDAKIKATNYGRVQNKLLFGSNSGLSIQIAPENMPPYPLMPIHIKLKGLTGHYMTNAQSWAFDANGIIAGCDALYWGVVGSNP